MAVTSIVFPETQEWVGIAAELVAGTVVNPAVTIPVEKAEPDEKPVWLTDKSLNGPVYLDTIGHLLRNIFGDYAATGSTPTNATTFTGALAVGATTGTLTS